MTRSKEITGRHVLITALIAFGVILAANMTMVLVATESFPGLVEKNSYVASQKFNEDVARRKRLGWTSEVDYAEGRLAVQVRDADGAPHSGLTVSATVGRPAGAASDRVVEMIWDGAAYAAPLELGSGLWRVEVAAEDDQGDRLETTARFQLP